MLTDVKNRDEGKKAAAAAALTFVHPGMTIGLGTGSTVRYFIEALGKNNPGVQAIATSKASETLAKACGISLLDPEQIDLLDIANDGADEVDPEGRMIKGGGGALLREKIAAKMAGGLTVIIEASKKVHRLGAHPLALEVLPWGKLATERELRKLGFLGVWRKGLSDNGNALFDVHFPALLSNPEEVNLELLKVPGVLATGFFFDLASRIIVGYGDGKVQIS